MNGTRQHSAGRERGAALIVAIGVLTLLLVIALTFFRASIGDVRTAQNTVDGVRAELLADGATALAIGFLNHDRFIHPSYTSLDFAWRTYFNGTFAAGKPHLWAPLQDPAGYGVHRMSPLRKGIVEINPRRLTDGQSDALYIPRLDIGYFPTLGDFSQAYSVRDYVTINADDELQNPFILTADLADPADQRKRSPIESMLNDPRLNGRVVFPEDFDQLEKVVYDDIAPDGRLISLRENMINAPGLTDATNETLPYEQVHFLADVDNDGNGLNDSVWIPVGADRYYPEDGLDNDLDGYIDGADIDGEPGVFMYRGDSDGIDNDFDNIVDEEDEYNYVTFSVPVPWRADQDGNGTLDRVLPTAQEIARMGITNSDIVRFEGDVNPSTGEPIEIGQGRVGNYIYSRDNDYDLVMDQPVDASHYMLGAPYDVNGNGHPDVLDALADYASSGVDNYGTTDPTIPVTPYLNLLVQIIGPDDLLAWQLAGAHGVPIPTWGRDGIDNDGDGQIDEGDEYAYLIQGETMTELTGRIAVLITDESSKVNINAAGGWSYPVFPQQIFAPDGPLLGLDSSDSTLDNSPLQRSFAEGVGPHEFDTRVVPDIGAPRARWLWQYRMGARQGYFAQGITTPIPFTLPYHTFEYEGDATLPGYGYVDDNANILQLALSRINNRGGPNYVTDPLSAADVINPRIDLGLRLGKWDGIDEPEEYQTFRPYRNIEAEGNGDNNDGDDVIDEIGELGDQYFRTTQQLKLINAGTVNNAGFETVRGFNDDDVFSALSDYITVHSTDRNERHFHQDSVLARFDQSKGRQTTGQRKDLNLTRSGDVARAAKRDWSFPASVAEEWSLAGGVLNVREAVLLFGENPANYNPLDQTTMPSGGYTIDFLLGLRQENTSVLSEESIMDYDPAAGRMFTMLADPELRAHQVAATLKDYADLDYTRSLDDQIFMPDYWWRRMARRAFDSDATLADAERLASSQRIYHTVAGLEAIRINEVMVRPVRRFEAEAVTDLNQADLATLGVNIPTLRGLDPNRFVPHNNVYPPATRDDAEEIEKDGFRVRVQTTTQAIEDYNTRESDNIAIVTTGEDGSPAVERWLPRPLFNVNGSIAADAGLLGLKAAWATYRRYITVTDPEANGGEGANYQVPDVVQFSFQATEGLPAGRYYVTVNTQYFDEDEGYIRSSVGRPSDFLFAVKTGTLEQDWFADVMNIDSYVNAGQIYNQAWRSPALLGSDDLGGSAGMAFLQGDAVFRFNPNVLPGDQFTTTFEDFRQNNAVDRSMGFTIEIPERTQVVPPALAPEPEDDRWVHIAFRRGYGPVDNNNEDRIGQNRRGFVINYLEFSQEPDHEWVEVTNQSDDEVDISGWQLVVEAHPLGIGPMTVPPNTVIAPRGMLLLGTNKFDYGNNIAFDINDNPITVLTGDGSFAGDPDLFDRGSGFFSNGIGLAAESSALGFANDVFFGVTVPQILYDELDSTQGTVFNRPGLTPADYLDNDGDGIEDIVAPPAVRADDEVISTRDPVLVSGALPQSPTKAWDRVVELIIPDLVPQQTGTNFGAAEIGRIVLGGGIFPNRPEQDFTDNDGDNRILAFDGIDNDGDEFERTGDNVDNDQDGAVDEPGEGIDEVVEPVGDVNPVTVRVYEGVDEGRFLRNERLADEITPVPGGYNREIPRYRTTFFDVDTNLANLIGIQPAFWTGDGDPNDGLLEDNPPQWKEFMERRNFPGDNVIVTLYEGPAHEQRVADRITYTQRDVENRQIDDTVLVTDFDMNLNGAGGSPFGDVTLADPGVQRPLDDRFESFWPENTMGQDFARSLERKHPDYTGDRFGTQNRFQATDGNYDDWSDSTGRWAREMSIDGTGVLQDTRMLDRRLDIEYRHALGGTPLRRNVSARIAEEPSFTTPPAERLTTFETVSFRNRPLVSPGDALTMPHTTRRMFVSGPMANAITAETFMFDPASTNIAFENAARGVGDMTWDSVMMGQRFDDSPMRNAINFFHEERAFIGDVGTTDAVSLNVGQATVIQVDHPVNAGLPLTGEAWTTKTNVTGQIVAVPPQVWAPLMLFPLPDDTTPGAPQPPFGFDEYGYDRQYLFQQMPSLGLAPTTVDNDRWPRELRTAVYASRNVDAAQWDPSDPISGAQAVFVWDGDDGLENGEYDLYIVATEDLSLLARADDEMRFDDPNDPDDPFDQRLLTDTDNVFGGQTGIGAPFVAAADGTANNEVYFDIEVLRDSNGDRKAWTPDLAPGDFLRDNQLQRGGAGIPAESFGVLRNVQPDADGVIRYGNVRVENNFLAVSIRDRSQPGTVVRISRVILTARGKTPGRININTVETKRINTVPDDDEQHQNFYNPLEGLPGILDRYADDNAVGPADMFVNEGDDPLNPIVESTTTVETENDRSAAFFARRIVEQRLRLLREQPDGRYYELASDLLLDAHFARVADNPATATLSDAALHPPLIAEYSNYLADADANGVVDSDVVRSGALREQAFRFGKMQNLITVKGEVFEILVTAQSGYGTDANGDGRINWRDDSEFTPMAEKTARTIYER